MVKLQCFCLVYLKPTGGTNFYSYSHFHPFLYFLHFHWFVSWLIVSAFQGQTRSPFKASINSLLLSLSCSSFASIFLSVCLFYFTHQSMPSHFTIYAVSMTEVPFLVMAQIDYRSEWLCNNCINVFTFASAQVLFFTHCI